ncbi:MAG TPA: tRNA preQ1(34) S-adenosylmethionine ribosyltransferase-isomerase QueA [Syntrophomonadaceae bacterium]|nr:tRNA preQ1(34) S-adenosylmethionine ribosyltransferase-isomerase QueA [Syntrophomonadaceae bacterium]HPR93987.1 tRNA preQ1(34) S-adenosylmethionine ribosyltransferase-isomerase QueA [Syntrophomonadaceae bacterium]
MSDDNKIFNLNSYSYDLPVGLIAQYPVSPRDFSRLLVLDRRNGDIKDEVFRNIVQYFEKGDTLVLNKTRVIPARLFGYKDSGAKAEIFLLRKRGLNWEALVKPARRLPPGTIIKLESAREYVEILEETDTAGGRLVTISNCEDETEFLNKFGHIPLPPYIDRQDEITDKECYQTVYARDNGSAAAPTAGLHFTSELIDKLESQGVNIVTLVLHVGIGTFRPVITSDIRDHKMHFEFYQIDDQAAALLNKTKKSGKKIIAVGTTVVRTLETVYNDDCGFSVASGETNKFIYPGYEFQAIDGLITNFHLPKSSLIMLVSAFAGLENTMSAYRHAINKRYRFFSYGDAMFIK